MSNEPLVLNTQVLNHNLENPNLRVRHRVRVEFIRDRDLTESLLAIRLLAGVEPVGIVPEPFNHAFLMVFTTRNGPAP